jgi:Flp pilus assembly pilin Flp
MKSKPASSRRHSLLARCRTLVWALARPFRGRSSGATMVEYLIVTGFISLVAIGVFNRYGVNLNKSFKAEAKLIEGEGLPSAGDLLGGLGDVAPPFCTIADRNNPFCVGGNCFAEGTPVATEGGDRPIESIRVGDRVWAQDVETGLVELRPVTTLFVRPDVSTIDMEISAGSHSEHVTVTPGHRFWVEGQGWIPAQDLERSPLASLQESLLATPVSGVPPPEQGQLGTTPLTSGPRDSLLATPRSSGGTTTTVYNLEVDGFHSYFVGHLHALVHNQNVFPDPLNCPLPPSGTGGTSSQGTGGGAGATPPAKGTLAAIQAAGLPQGGSYRQVRSAASKGGPDGTSLGGEVNHMPAWNSWEQSGDSRFSRDTAPAIWMETADHRAMTSTGSSAEAKAFRAEQAELIKEGKIMEAVQMDIDEIHEKYGSKYDEGIAEMLAYLAAQGIH